jgi:hypothetical protein
MNFLRNIVNLLNKMHFDIKATPVIAASHHGMRQELDATSTVRQQVLPVRGGQFSWISVQKGVRPLFALSRYPQLSVLVPSRWNSVHFGQDFF